MEIWSRALIHYYHLYTCNEWRRILGEHIYALTDSGLLKKIDFRVVVVGDDDSMIEAKSIVESAGGNVVVHENEGFEQVTLKELYASSISTEVDDLVFYAHSKGTAYPAPIQERWRRQMTYWNVYEHEEIIKHLNSGFHAAGIHWMDGLPSQNQGFFGGNFWWSKMSAIKTLPLCPDGDRYVAELWIGWLEKTIPEFRKLNLYDGPIGYLTAMNTYWNYGS